MAGLSNSEYRKQQEDKATFGKLLWQLTKLLFFVVVALIAPVFVLAFWLIVAFGVMFITVIGGALKQPGE